jgi:hypothetical protein
MVEFDDHENGDYEMTESYTKEEMREMFLYQCKEAAFFWSRVEDRTPREMCDGVVFSILNIIDGTSGGFPAAINLVMEPHPDDKEYCISNDKKWVENGQIINNDVMLHDCYYR